MDPSHPTRLPPLQGPIHQLHPHSFQSHHQSATLPHLGGGYYGAGNPVSPTSASHGQQHGFYPPPSNQQSHITPSGHQQYQGYAPPIPQSPSSAHRPLDPSLQGPDPSKNRKRKDPPGSSASPALGPPPGSAGSGIIPLGNANPAATPPPNQGQLLGVGQNSEDEPLYVNAKQYHRILKRRAARAKIEEGNKGNKNKKPYLHESRHKHAMRRPRGPGGRFLTGDEIRALEAQQQQSGQTQQRPESSHGANGKATEGESAGVSGDSAKVEA